MEQKTVQFLSFWKSLINGYKSTSEVPCIYTSKVLFTLDDDRIVQRLKHAYCMVLSDIDQDRVTAEKMVTPELRSADSAQAPHDAAASQERVNFSSKRID